ncbi:MAG: hypothetical protein NTW28_31385, partial [Candidatus Solibacter sp.]|nr:hypothetical protein [Candidatus Solibacter sp.]
GLRILPREATNNAKFWHSVQIIDHSPEFGVRAKLKKTDKQTLVYVMAIGVRRQDRSPAGQRAWPLASLHWRMIDQLWFSRGIA